MDKDIISVLLDDGSRKDMELVLLYTDDISKRNYVLYKELDKDDECYAASYKKSEDSYIMDTNLNEHEIYKLQLLLNSQLERNK